MNFHPILQPTPTIVRNNSVNPTNWIRYQGSQQIPYQQHQFIGSSIPSFRQQIAPRHQPRHIMQRPSNAIVIIDPKTKQPIELVKSSSISNQRTNQCNLFPNGGHYRKEQFEGKCFNKNRPKIKDPDTNHCRDFTGCVSSDQVDTNNNDLSVNTHVAKDQEVLKNTEPSVEPIVNVPIVIPFVIPIVVLESVINNEEKKAVDDLNIILPEPVPEVKQCLDPPIIPSSINEVIQIGPSFVESKPPKTVKNKAPVAPKPSNEGKSNKLSKNNEKNKRRRAAIVKQPYLKSKKEIIEITTAVATAAAEELHLNDEIIVVEPKPKTEIIVRYTNADLLSLMNSKASKKKPRLDSRCFRIQTNNGNLMKTLKADLNNLIKTKIEPYEVNSPLIITQSCPSLSKYPQGMIRISLSETKVMKGVENAWTPKCIQVNVNVADGLEQEIVKKFRSVLNKLCPENFNKMLEEVKVLEMNSSSVLNQCIRLLFEKAIADVCFTPTYALMCASIRDLQKDKCVFLTHLVSFCQEEFERFQKGFDDNTDEEGQKKFHRDTIGTVRFIGELYNIKIVDDKIAGECIKMLMDPKTIGDVSLESLCNLLKTIGSRIEENNKITELIDDCYKQLHDIITNKTVAISSRIKFAIMDLLELKTSCWKERRIVEAPKKLNEIADAMQKEDDKNAELTRRFCQNNRISRNFNDINNKMSTTTVVDQRYKNVNGNHTEVNSVDQIDVNATVRNTSNPDNYINNTNTKIMINNSTKNVVKKVHFEINNDEDILKIKKFKKSKYKSSFDRPNTSITIEKRNDYRYQRTDDKINQTNNFVAKNPVVNNRCKDFSDTPRIQPRFHQSHHDNYEPKNRKVEGNNSNRQQHQEQWISRGFNNRRDVSRNDNNQHGDHANYDNSYKTCYKSITKNQIYHEPNIIRETWRSKTVGESNNQNPTSREPVKILRHTKSSLHI